MFCFRIPFLFLAIFSTSTTAFEPYPDKADMLAVIAHPDDEGYWGGLLAYYASCQQKKVVLVCLSSGEWGNGLPHPVEPGEKPDCSYDDSHYPCFAKIPEQDLVYPCYYREGEMARAAIAYGLAYQPIMPRWKDMADIQPWGNVAGGFELWGGKEKVTEYITSQIRRFKPDVVVGLSWDGGNGNPQHMAAAHGTFFACQAAGDSKRFTAQLATTPLWQPKKVYFCISKEEETEKKYDVVHSHSWSLPCKGRPGTARIMAARGNACHESQEMKEECDPTTGFLLKISTVGPDVVGKNNLFENLP